jgi:arsenate reductase-like glutaredoxin family protein
MEKFTVSLNSPTINQDLIGIRDRIEDLIKSKKQYSQMLKDDPKKDEIVKWLKDLGINSNWGIWWIRNYKKDPKVYEDQHHRTVMEHFAGMTHLDEVNKLRFDKTHDFETGYDMLKEAQDTGLARVQENDKSVKPKGEKIVDLGDGWGWYDLGVSSCEEEGDSMGHCGNSGGSENDRILHLTFISDNKVLGEMKGRSNQKPNAKYHHAILKLLESDHVHSIAGGGYLPENNFELSDLKDNPKMPGKYEELMNNKPIFGISDYENLTEDQKIRALNSLDEIEYSEGNYPEQLATYYDTHPDVLEHLAYEENYGPTIAKNHNTPPEILANLAGPHPYEVARNPSTPYETQNELFHQSLPHDPEGHMISALISKSQIYPQLMNDIVDHLGTYKAFDDDMGNGLLLKLARHNLMSSENLDKMSKFNNLPSNVEAQIAGHKNTSPQTLQNIFNRYEDLQSRSSTVDYIASNPNTPEEVLNDIVSGGRASLLYSVARNPSITNDMVNTIVDYMDSDLKGIRFADQKRVLSENLAGNESVDPFVLDKIFENNSTNKNSDIHRRLVNNKNINPSTAEKIVDSVDLDFNDFNTLSHNNKLSPNKIQEIVEKTMGGEVSDLRRIRPLIQSNSKNTSSGTLTYVLDKLKSLDDKSWYEEFASHIAGHKNTPKVEIKEIYDYFKSKGDEYNYSFYTMATNPYTPQEILTELGNSTDPEIRRGLVTNTSASPDLLQQLIDTTTDEETLGALMTNPSLSKEQRQAVLQSDKATRFVRGRALSNNELSAETIHDIVTNAESHDTSWFHDIASNHPNVSDETLQHIHDHYSGDNIPTSYDAGRSTVDILDRVKTKLEERKQLQAKNEQKPEVNTDKIKQQLTDSQPVKVDTPQTEIKPDELPKDLVKKLDQIKDLLKKFKK